MTTEDTVFDSEKQASKETVASEEPEIGKEGLDGAADAYLFRREERILQKSHSGSWADTCTREGAVSTDESETKPSPLVQPKVQMLSKKMKVATEPKQGSKKSTIAKLWSRVYSRRRSHRIPGGGVMGKLFNRSFRHMSDLSPNVSMQLDEFVDYRPYFTYWVTTVQILVMIIALATYGFGPIGFSRRSNREWVLQPSMVLEQVSFFEQENLWIGPSYADLVHLGAKYAPCMRRDLNIYSEIAKKRTEENNTACCILNDNTACYQSRKDECSVKTTKILHWLAQWEKWTEQVPGPEGRLSGSVCGQDPRDCMKPASLNPYVWPDDITRWPICASSSYSRNFPHTRCEISGRPCCIGIQGECRITTREYCDFVKGYFHEEATLCSQVSCLGEVCGMIPFFRHDRPDQFIRLFIPLFLHAGIIHCAFTVLLQFVIMRDLERLIGWLRLAIIYIISGVTGNLASAVFVPYHAEVGPSGSQFGLLAGLIVDVVYSWRFIAHPWKALSQLLLPLLLLFVAGLMPWIDNYAHFFGFLAGFLLSLALFPFIQFKKHDSHLRLVIILVSLAVLAIVIALLIVFFVVTPLWSCEICVYLNCIEISPHFCDNKGLELNLEQPPVHMCLYVYLSPTPLLPFTVSYPPSLIALTMNHAEEQAQEIEVLLSMYPDELTIVKPDYPARFSIFVSSNTPEEDEKQSHVASCILEVILNDKYPKELPEVSISSENMTEENIAAITEKVAAVAADSIGAPMIFTLVCAVQKSDRQKLKLNFCEEKPPVAFWSIRAFHNISSSTLIMFLICDFYIKEELDVLSEQSRRNYDQMMEQKRIQLEETETQRVRGTPVTVESFLAWKNRFVEEMTKLRKKQQTAVAISNRLTGREQFLRDSTLYTSDMKLIAEIGEDVPIDEELFQDLDDIELGDDSASISN
ncbi:unnamed protein product [Soboliphyme baturini]|uniref:RWD domain-containing protein n=1 Tax=Soboliphyme baturini TaxID=241478 RepID=A0A3P8B093_9BILA|nr:unnamed protein product [Soboliphyme baturini]